MRIFTTLFFTILILSSFNANAAYIRKSADGGSVKWSSHQSFVDFAMKFEQTAPINSRAPAELTRNVRYNSPALKNLLKLKSLTPTGFAFTAALTAAGYLWDTETEDVLFQDPNYIIPSIAGACSLAGAPGNSSGCFSAISSLINTSGDPERWSTATASGTYDYQTSYEYAGNTYWQNRGYNFRPTVTPSVGDTLPSPNDEPEPQPITDEEFMSEVAPQIAWGDVAFPDNNIGTQPIPTPELQQAEDTINQWFTENYVDNSVTTSTSTTTNTITNPDGTQTTTGTEETELPAFCTWAGIVCDAINWMREPFESPTDVLLPTEEVEIPPYTSGLPDSGSCPAPYDVTAFGTAIAISYQPFCDLASIIRPLVLAASGLFAAYILVGRGAKS